MHACSAVLGRNRACISQGSLASLPRSPDFEPHRQKNALRSAAVRCAKRGRSGGRTRCCRRAGACHGPEASCDASCGAASGRAAGRMRCCRRGGACYGYGPGASYDASCGTASGRRAGAASERVAGRMRCCRRAGAASG